MIVEKRHFHYVEKYWGGQDPPTPPPSLPCSDGLVTTAAYFKVSTPVNSQKQ